MSATRWIRACGWLWVMAFGVGIAPTASTGAADPRSNSALVVLEVARDDPGKAREARFLGELALALEEVPVESVRPRHPDFASRSLADQLPIVRSILEDHDGLAACWLVQVSSELVLLNMVVLSSGRALVRLVETDPRQQGLEIDLAIASRELLGTAFLFQKPPVTNEGLTNVVRTVREQAAPAPSSKWAFMLLGLAGGGIAGQAGPSLLGGGAISVEYQFTQELAGRLLLDTFGGPFDGVAGREINGLTVAPGVGAAYLLKLGPVFLGPVAELRLIWSNLWVEARDSTTQGIVHWSLRMDGGAQARWSMTEKFSLIGSVACGLTPLTRKLTLRSTGETLFATPYVTWHASLGLLARF